MLKCLNSCILIQWLTLYRTSVICSVFIAIHTEINDFCFKIFIRLCRYLFWISASLPSEDYEDYQNGLIYLV